MNLLDADSLLSQETKERKDGIIWEERMSGIDEILCSQTGDFPLDKSG